MWKTTLGRGTLILLIFVSFQDVLSVIEVFYRREAHKPFSDHVQ